MYATIQKWGNSQGLRIPKALLDAVGLKEHDRVELVPMDDGINIRRASATPHRTCLLYTSGQPPGAAIGE